MQKDQDVVLLRVEKARQKLYQTHKRYVLLTHPKVIEQSMRLDVLLNQHQCKKPICR